MDTFVDSSWYFLRYCDPRNPDAPFSRELANYWMPVRQYTGGIEHAILHLMYARFFMKVLADAGMVDVQEPFEHLFTQGMITKNGAKMSKSKGNVVPVDDLVETLGADTGRLFVLFMGPPDEDAEWTDEGAEGMKRFLNRVWRLLDGEVTLARPGATSRPETDYSQSDRDLLRKMHNTIQKVTFDIERFHFNTAVSAIMELVNAMQVYRDAHGTQTAAFSEAATSLLLMLAPMAPHITEELWHRAGGTDSVHTQAWPTFNPELAAAETITLVIQVNGKVRDRVTLPANATEEEARKLALSNQKVQPYLDGKQIRQVHYVPGRLVNIVV
jgi:leucyl-tRNA synthetase